jgi:hypothetical protein
MLIKTILNLFDASYNLKVNTYASSGADTALNTNMQKGEDLTKTTGRCGESPRGTGR